MKSTLLAAVAHDLKTPITAALGALENWQARAGGSEEARLAHEELERLSRNVSDLLEVVRLDSGAARPRREVVTGGEIVEAAVARFGGALAAHTLFVDVPAREAAVEVDPGQVTEALGHGLENAARYSPPGTEIRVSASADEKTVSLRVSDRGRGIPAADRERVFERFVRLGNDADVPGTGLGLSIARSLVAMNGGELTIGAAQGGGTLFQIALPRAE
jgi:two-component system sensor histidine kinase KdpD